MYILAIVLLCASVRLLLRKQIVTMNAEKRLLFDAGLVLLVLVFPCLVWMAYFFTSVDFRRGAEYSDTFKQRYIYNKMKLFDCRTDGDCPPVNDDGLIAVRNYEIPKPGGVKRIVLLGDSFAAGYRLGYEDSLGYNLEKLLGGNAEVINAAFKGANSTAEVEFFFSKVSRYEPDFILVRYRIDDIFSLDVDYYEDVSWRIVDRWDALWPKALKSAFMKKTFFAIRNKYEKYFFGNPDLVLQKELFEPFGRLREYAAEKNIEVMMISDYCPEKYGGICEAVEKMAAENSWSLLRLYSIDTLDFSAPELRIPGDGHPTGRANELLAGEVYKYIVQNNLSPARWSR